MRKKPDVDGYLHARISYALAAVLLVGGTIVGVPLGHPYVGALMGIGCAFGAYWSPDYDQEMMIWGKWKLYKMLPPLSWLLGSLWIAYWTPYALLMKHRGISHTPVLGTFTRLLYLFALPIVGISISSSLESVLRALASSIPITLPLVVGLIVSDIGHWYRDGTGFKI